MQYLGGKSRIAKNLVETMLAATIDRHCYVEPFVGAGSVAVRMAPHFASVMLNDSSPDLIALWKAVQRGWTPPETVTEGMYLFQRSAPVSAMRGFVGYGCSFGGKWFGGYARNSRGDNYAAQASHSLTAKAAKLSNAFFTCLDYASLLIPDGSVVYLDPPYEGVTGYTATGRFDNQEFFRWAEKLSSRASVFLSEYQASAGWVPLWSGSPQAGLKLGDKTGRAAEHLWVYEPAIMKVPALRDAA